MAIPATAAAQPTPIPAPAPAESSCGDGEGGEDGEDGEDEEDGEDGEDDRDEEVAVASNNELSTDQYVGDAVDKPSVADFISPVSGSTKTPVPFEQHSELFRPQQKILFPQSVSVIPLSLRSSKADSVVSVLQIIHA